MALHPRRQNVINLNLEYLTKSEHAHWMFLHKSHVYQNLSLSLSYSQSRAAALQQKFALATFLTWIGVERAWLYSFLKYFEMNVQKHVSNFNLYQPQTG
jgi:hypothetical protein